MKNDYPWEKNIRQWMVALVIWSWIGPLHAAAEPAAEQLIIFTQTTNSPVSTAFRQDLLPEIKKLAQDVNLSVKTVEVTQDGVPPEIKITPLIVYQNHLGRSIYQGRSTTLSRIRNFIRTSRYVPQGKDPLIRKKIPIWKMGRSRVWAPLKIAAVTGTRPPGYQDPVFQQKTRENIYNGFQHFQAVESMALGRADRGFYMDFYPWVSADHTLFLSFAVFSQFHCKEPIFHTRKKPLVGPWENRAELFQKAAQIMEKIVFEKINDPQIGDGFEPVGDSIPIISWKKAGLSRPLPPEKMTRKTVNAEVPRSWILTPQQIDHPPLVLFRFPAPLDQYAGEATKGKGEFQLPQNRDPAGAAGYVEIDPNSVTMGQSDLDKVIHSSLMLNTKKYPVSKFVIQSGAGEGQQLRYGSLMPVLFHGNLEIKGKTIPLDAIMEMEPTLNDDGEPVLILSGSFTIDLNDFTIPGPDGPAESNHTLLFDVNFRLKPK